MYMEVSRQIRKGLSEM